MMDYRRELFKLWLENADDEEDMGEAWATREALEDADPEALWKHEAACMETGFLAGFSVALQILRKP